MRAIHQGGAFRSLTYRDMPFPLAPNLWAKVSARWRQEQVDAAPRERAHGDRILTGVDSPEALDEVFWRMECGSDYIRRDALVPHRVEQRTIERFRAYVAAVIASGGEGQHRYLSKNNNNVLRLPVLIEAFPRASVVIPFRDPASHAASLWRQHRHFTAMQAENPFVRRYMDWLVHREFGSGHRPFRFGDRLPEDLTPDQPDYWLEIWMRVHTALVEQASGQMVFVCYEDLCSDPAVWQGIAQRLGLETGRPDFSASTVPVDLLFDPARLARACALYADMREWVV
ncbi:sulfotransferase [Novosphingobium sp. 9]|uniref:sulfotransferase n=1 Tax=Novosphingobium sp. 9 TaxID=2025349 RepID=UPI0021B6AD28|nr:sulfotransferase [Novosphingobium sp. 9]